MVFVWTGELGKAKLPRNKLRNQLEICEFQSIFWYFFAVWNNFFGGRSGGSLPQNPAGCGGRDVYYFSIKIQIRILNIL